LDISVEDISFGVLSCGWQLRREKLEAEVMRRCALEEEGLVCLSVRSGWDLWLGAQGLRAGDEVLVSAITHPDMIRIIHEHGLRAVPVDIDPETLAPRPWMLEAALTPRTRVVRVAHLFGGRMDLGGIAKFARKCGLLLVDGGTVAGGCRHLFGRRTAPLRRALRRHDHSRYHRAGVPW
jgi:dTDP-4-amino-4,6-dideoxygalactose transaminase